MKGILFTVLNGLLFAGISFAQNTIPPGTAAQPQTASPGSQQIPEPSATQPQSQPSAQPQTGSQPAQAQPGTSASQNGHATKIAPGSVIPVQLTKTIDAKKAKTGDEVVAKVTQDMKTNSGEVLVPKDTKVVGHVIEAQPRSKEQKESQMAIAFDRAITKDGNTMQMPMSIQAIIGQQQNNNANAPGGNEPASGPSGSSGAPMPGGSARSSGMAGSTPPTPSPSAAGGGTTTDPQTANNANPPITGQTQGVVGISNLTLQAGPNGNQGSVITSDKNNVKLESGTMLLLKVNQ